jgi:hypothetical protein
MTTKVENERERYKASMLELEASIASIKSQITAAKSKAAVYGQYADHDWFVRVNDALNHKRREHQRLQFELGRVNREIKAAGAKAFDARFIDVARKMLPKETYVAILSQVAA